MRFTGGTRPVSRASSRRPCLRSTDFHRQHILPRLHPLRIMPKIFPLLTSAALSLCAALASAQEAPSIEKVPEPAKPELAKKEDGMQLAQNIATPRPKPKPTVAPGAVAPIPEVISTPAPKKPNFFKRLFGPRPKKEEATPTPEPTTTPTPTPRKTARPAATTSEPAKSRPTVVTKQDMPVVASPPPAKTTSKTATTPAPPKTAAKSKPAVEPPADLDPDAQEKFRFDQAKAKAMEDPQVIALKTKADNASTEVESSKALRAYNKALFEKIRKLDKSVSERATRLEEAILKRLSE